MGKGSNQSDLFLQEVINLIGLSKGDLRNIAEYWLTAAIEKFPEALEKQPATTLLARELGLWDTKHLAPTIGDGFYQPPASCQIPPLPALLEKHFGRKTDGIFFETGAFDGETFSNTSFLADLGWRGVYLEPIRTYFDFCRLRHAVNPNVTVLQGAAAADFGTLTLDMAAMSTTAVPEFLAEARDMDYVSDYVSGEKQQAWCFPLNFVLEQQKFPQAFDLMVLDVEGFEYEALKGLDLDHWQPKMIIIELCDRHPEFSKNATLMETAMRCREILSKHYVVDHIDESNTVYIRRT
ncbi:FkbM family methyltransferase [Lacibacterium aquatile]|uniref:FkbM family methyltransferase n=1 Tax=Lacibacterium aquatile TaxID=1168082 RepID=A0ABW5DTQ0_9PROT